MSNFKCPIILLLSLISLTVKSPTVAGQTCDGPDCPLRVNGGYSPYRGDSNSRARTFENPLASAPCQCGICDPRFPCTTDNCGRQGCEDCQGRCPSCANTASSRPSLLPSALNGAPTRSWNPISTGLAVQRLCPVTGKELGSMGPPVTVNVLGRSIQVCCPACVSQVQRNPQKYLARVEGMITDPPSAINEEFTPSDISVPISRAMIQTQTQRLCPVTGEALGSMGPPIPVAALGKTIYVCCRSCVRAVQQDPLRYLRIVEQQSAIPASFPKPFEAGAQWR